MDGMEPGTEAKKKSTRRANAPAGAQNYFVLLSAYHLKVGVVLQVVMARR